MNYEQKYKKALSFLKDLKPHMSDYCIEKLEAFFPELKESEDERIRKEIIAYLDVQEVLAQGKDGDFKKWIAWLEKQCERTDYNPYKATIESIAAMVENYANNGDLKDFYNNVAVKCHDAIEYDKTWGNKVIIEKVKKEEELTEFEKMLRYVLECYSGYEVTSKSEIESLKLNAKRLFDLARKELQPEFDKELEKAYKTQDDVVYRNGYAQGKQDALKAALESLPKWKKVTKTKNFDNHILIFEDEERVALTTVIYEGEYYIELDDLKTLPKEE